MRADLHTHTTASDGALTPEALVAHAISRGLDVLAVTDHDSVAGVSNAIEAAEGSRVLIIPGVELSAVHDGRDVHVLGYFIDYEDPHLLAHLEDLRLARLHRAESIVEALQQAGYDLRIDDVLALAGGGSVGRSHVARALVNGGHVESIPDAFADLLGRGKPFYVTKDVRSPVEVLDVIRSAGGLSVLAHPGVTRVDDLLPELIEAGLSGIEAYHAEHSDEDRVRYARMAEEHGLLVTGGSDYHGIGSPSADLGDVDLPAGAAEGLLADRP
jgi:predicted metal-dependent phosphoesterase TrpH